jgi:hypothetical protein
MSLASVRAADLDQGDPRDAAAHAVTPVFHRAPAGVGEGRETAGTVIGKGEVLLDAGAARPLRDQPPLAVIVECGHPAAVDQAGQPPNAVAAARLVIDQGDVERSPRIVDPGQAVEGVIRVAGGPVLAIDLADAVPARVVVVARDTAVGAGEGLEVAQGVQRKRGR